MIESNRNKDLEKRIEAYLNDELTTAEVDELWAELIDNEYYFDYMKSVANLKKISEEREKETGLQKVESQKKVWLSAAAAIILMIGAATIFNISTQSGEMVTPISSIELDYYRSADGMASENLEAESDVVRLAISTANTGDVTEALSLINEELEKTDSKYEQAELLITSGSILYNSGRFDDAIERFETALEVDYNDTILRERNLWYLGNAYFQVNKLDEAKATLEEAFELNGAYSRVAQSYLRALSAR
ncbi:MAG: tetratricopeptide repeat protein [Balneolaceae bacterium]